MHYPCFLELELTEVAAVCEVQGMNSPLVLGIRTSKTKKLSVSYCIPSICSPDDDESSSLFFNFGNVILKRAVTKQLLITNQTAIPAPFSIEAEYFSCSVSKSSSQSEKRSTYVKRPLHSVQAKKIEEKAHEDFVSSLLAYGKGAAFFLMPNTGMLGPFETQSVDVTAYTDMWGEYRDNLICKVGDLEPTLIPVQMTVKGCPLYFQITGPQADDQNKGPNIQFGSHISGGDTVSRSLRINNPTMFDIRMDWETYNVDKNDRKLVDVVVAFGDAFPVKDADGNETGGEEEESITEFDSEKESISLHPCHAKNKLLSVHIRPHVGSLSDYPYCITPQQIVIPAKGSSTIHVSFTPLTLSGSACESKCVGKALGFMSLDSEMSACVPGKVNRPQGLDLEPVRMNLLAVVKPAVLLVQMEEDEGVLEFHASAGDLLGTESEKELLAQELDIIQTLRLKNTSEMPLHFKLKTQPPFFVLKPNLLTHTSTSSNTSTTDSQSLVLQPQRSMQVKIAFHCSLTLLDHVDEADEERPSGVMLIQSAFGWRKLRFQQNLQIHYSNSSLQTVPLCANLDLSTLHLSSESIDFGFCYVGKTQIKEVKLYCHGAHTYWKSHIDSDESDADVFRVTPDFGLLRPKELHVASSSECLQISFTASGDREFRALVVIRSPLVKTSLTVQLKGTGSFNEQYNSDQT